MRFRDIWLATVMLLVAIPAPSIARHSHYHRYAPVAPLGGGYYRNVNGHRVHRPVRANLAPDGATARCYDGSWSFSENHRGTCSHHGGVARWL